MTPGCVFVVVGSGSEASVEDPHETVPECSKRLCVGVSLRFAFVVVASAAWAGG